MYSKKILTLLTLILLAAQSFAALTVPKLVGDNMVLQRDIELPIWGSASPSEEVSVTINEKIFTTKADANGKWSLKLPKMIAGGPFKMIIKGATETLSFQNIMVGEVWLCSGQSNMEFKLAWLGDAYKEEISKASFPNLRFIDIVNTISLTPKKEIDSKGWEICSPATASEISAVAYFFAKNLQEKYKVPVGLILSEWGGTDIEAWISGSSLKKLPTFKSIVEEIETSKKSEADLDKEYQAALLQWNSKVTDKDKGVATQVLNINSTFNDWKTMNIPQAWENEIPGFDGVVWYRKEIDLPKEAAGKDLILNLSVIDDHDTTYFNGQKVGATQTHTANRRYKVPGNLVKAGKNIVIVRVVDTGGGGGLWGEKDSLYIKTNNKIIPLSGKWQYKPSVDFKEVSIPLNKKNQHVPSVLYNGMIEPLVPYAIKGVIWYQGENNAGRAHQYQTLFPLMIQDWRTKWGQGDFPFLYVQLANFMQPKEEPTESDWAELREAQLMTLSVPKTGMAVIIDTGEANDIHPKNKHDVGKRLALLAQKIAYNETIDPYGPLYKSMTVEGDKIRLRFDNAESGFTVKGDGQLKEFTIAGADKKFYNATAIIEGNSILVYSPNVKTPVAVRYAWENNPDKANLFDKEGLPATPFRTDKFPGVTEGR